MSASAMRLKGLAFLFANIPAFASPMGQDTSYFPGYDMGTLMMNEATRSATLYEPTGSSSKSGGASSKIKAKSSVTRSTRALLYTPSRARTQKNVATFAAKMKVKDPKGAAEMTRLFASTDVMGLLQGEMKKLGLTKNNIADAYALWWTSAWLATQGRNDTPSKVQMKGVKAQATAALLKAPKIAKLTEAQKQEFAEAFLIQALLLDAVVASAKDDPQSMQAIKTSVADGAKATGLDLSTMKLTDKGFRPLR